MCVPLSSSLCTCTSAGLSAVIHMKLKNSYYVHVTDCRDFDSCIIVLFSLASNVWVRFDFF